jgi:hypothetical protein
MTEGNENHAKANGLRHIALQTLPLIILFLAGCGAFNMGKWKGLERTASDERFYLVKEAFLTGGSAYARKETFDHNMNESVNLFFIPKNEKNHYVAETRWFDPAGQEYRTIRQTYDVQQEHKTGGERRKEGTTRVHSMSTKELVNHKPGAWKVALYLDGALVRRLDFIVR